MEKKEYRCRRVLYKGELEKLKWHGNADIGISNLSGVHILETIRLIDPDGDIVSHNFRWMNIHAVASIRSRDGNSRRKN